MSRDGDLQTEAPEPWMAEGSVQGRIYSDSRLKVPIPASGKFNSQRQQ